MRKVLESAIANAENNQGADIDELKVTTIMVDAAPSLKRFMARAKGRGNRIVKRNSHITVLVGDGKKTSKHMGQKVNPIGIRLGITRDWTSKWYANKKHSRRTCSPTIEVREFLKKKLAEASVSRIHIERAARKATSRSTRRVRAS